MAATEGESVKPVWLRPAALGAAFLFHAGLVFGVPWPAVRAPAVTALLAIEVVPQGSPNSSLDTPDPAEAAEVRPTAAQSVDSAPAEAQSIEKSEPPEQERNPPNEEHEAKPLEKLAVRTSSEISEQIEAHPDQLIVNSIVLPARETVDVSAPANQAQAQPTEIAVRELLKRNDAATPQKRTPTEEKRKAEKPKAQSAASSASSASSMSRHALVATAAGAAASANYRSLVVAELNRRKFYPPAARDSGIKGVVVVAFSIGAAGTIAGYKITNSSGNGVLDGAIHQMMKAVSLPPPPGGSFHASVPIYFDLSH